MEALRTVRPPLAQAFDDSSRATTRKAVLLVTDGQPTFMRRDNDPDCKSNPIAGGGPLPSNGNSNAGGEPFTNGCKQGVPSWKIGGNQTHFMYRQPLSSGASCYVAIPGSWTSTSCPGSQTPSSDALLYQQVIRCTRSLVGCTTNGAMYEANVTRNCGYGNSVCSSGGEHDIVFFAIAIGKKTTDDPQSSMDENAKCMLARMANATDILNAATGVVETMTAVCNRNTPRSMAIHMTI